MENNKMDQVITELSKIEAAAAGIQNDMENEKLEYAKYIEKKTAEFDEQLERETTEKLAELSEKLEAEKKEELSAMRASILGITAKMEEIYNENHEKWVKDIVDGIIKE